MHMVIPCGLTVTEFSKSHQVIAGLCLNKQNYNKIDLGPHMTSGVFVDIPLKLTPGCPTMADF